MNTGESSSAGLIAASVSRPIATTMMVLAVAVFGAVSLLRLPVTLLPDVNYPTITVRTEYEGAAPSDIEKLVTRRLEEGLAVISDLVSYRSISRAGVSDVILEFAWNTKMAFAAQDVREKVDQVQALLPVGIRKPLLLRFDPTLDPVLRLALFPATDGATDLLNLRRIAEEELRRELENVPGVAAVRLRGGFEEEWRVELDEGLLKLHGVSATEVSERIALENANVAGGLLRDGDRESLVRTLGEVSRPEEIAELVVAERGDRPLRVRDLGRVVTDHKERDVITRIGGRESVEIEIFKEGEANLVKVAAAVKTRLYGADWRERLNSGEDAAADRTRRPKQKSGKTDSTSAILRADAVSLVEGLFERGIRLRLSSDQSVFVERSIGEVWESALIGGLLSILVLFAFLRTLGPTIIIAISIPVSVIATFAPLFLSGVSLNIMSLGGLALGLGMMVDASIVVLESIFTHRQRGLGRKEAAVVGTRAVGLAVVASTLTTVAVFFPIVFVEGVAGEFFRDQAIVVVFSLLASLAAALYVIPMLASLGRTETVAPEAPAAGWVRPWQWRRYATLRPLEPARSRTGAFLRWPVVACERLLGAPLEFAGRTLATLVLGLLWALRRIVDAISYAVRLILRPLGKGFQALEGAWTAALAITLRGALRVRLLVLLASGALVFFAYRTLPSLGLELVPEVHQGEFAIECQLEAGTPVATTDRIAQEFESLARRTLDTIDQEEAALSVSSGVARDVIAKAGDGSHTLRLQVKLEPRPDLEAEEDRCIAALRKTFRDRPEAQDFLVTRPTLFNTKSALELEVVGEELPRIEAAATELLARLRTLPGFTDIQSTLRAGHPELVIEPDRDQLAFHGLTAGGLANLVRDKIQGRISTRVSRGDRKVEVLVRADQEQLRSEDDVLGLRVNPVGDRSLSLSSVARVLREPGPAEIRRVGGERAAVISARTAGIDLRAATTSLENAAAALEAERPDLFSGVVVRLAGQREESERSLRSLLFALAIATLLVYIVMASQFESLVQPFVILLTIPLSLVGAVFALKFLAIKLSIIVLLGAILLVGIVVNNAIVLIDDINQRTRGGTPLDVALEESARARLRPILMTTLTTVLGLLPLALGLGEGTEIRTPMAVTVIAGLASSTLLTLIVIPVTLSLVQRSVRRSS